MSAFFVIKVLTFSLCMLSIAQDLSRRRFETAVWAGICSCWVVLP